MTELHGGPMIRLRWDGRRGAAMCERGALMLGRAPDLVFRYMEIDFQPGMCATVRREPWHKTDDLRPDEVAACARYLMQLEHELGPPDMAGDE
jgi:hypothetical protein